jgi:hypothetical protein
MKKLLAAAVAVSMLAVAAPASAQYRDNDRYDRSDRNDRDGRYDRDRDRNDWDENNVRSIRFIDARQNQLERRIYQGMRNGRLSEREAGRLRAAFGQIAGLEQRYRRGGFSRWEIRDLSYRLDRLDTLVTAEVSDRNNHRG